MRTLLLLLLLCSQDSIDTLIEKLGSDDLETREQASRAIAKIGRPALDALRKAMKSDKPEVAGRAKALVEEIDFPEPGASDNGLAIAIKAQATYDEKGKIVIAARMHNTSDKEIELQGIKAAQEGDNWLLSLGGKEEFHLCFRNTEPGPDVLDTLKIPRGKHVEFTFSPRAWCAMIEHSKCYPMPFKAGAYQIKLILSLPKSSTWSGKAISNEVHFTVK